MRDLVNNTVKVNYNNYKIISPNLLREFFKKPYNFGNFIRRRLSDHIT